MACCDGVLQGLHEKFSSEDPARQAELQQALEEGALKYAQVTAWGICQVLNRCLLEDYLCSAGAVSILCEACLISSKPWPTSSYMQVPLHPNNTASCASCLLGLLCQPTWMQLT